MPFHLGHSAAKNFSVDTFPYVKRLSSKIFTFTLANQKKIFAFQVFFQSVVDKRSKVNFSDFSGGWLGRSLKKVFKPHLDYLRRFWAPFGDPCF